jgi:hypothetical protein
MKSIVFSILTCIILVVTACKKEPGEGGRATIKGKLIVVDYDDTFTIKKDTFPAQGENIYIIYGDDNTIGDDVKTSYDGTFQFEYLRTGKYRIFAVSKDTAAKTSNKTIEVMQTIEIKDKKEIVTLNDIYIAD